MDRDTLRVRLIRTLEPLLTCGDEPHQCVSCREHIDGSAVVEAALDILCQPSAPAETKCRHCGEPIRLIDGRWIDAETYSVCDTPRGVPPRHEPERDALKAVDRAQRVDLANLLEQLCYIAEQRGHYFSCHDDRVGPVVTCVCGLSAVLDRARAARHALLQEPRP
jgi:hypothetical protein